MFGLGKPTTTEPLVVWFGDVDRADLALVGGKGANLGELTRAKLPVPPGFIVTAAAYRQFLGYHHLAGEIGKLLQGLNPEQTAELQRRATAIQRRLLEAPIPAPIDRAIRRAYDELQQRLGGNQFVAVRSSATAEDLPTASFAGQQATFLNIRGADAIVTAVHHAWASLFEARAIYYRIQQSIPTETVAIAVPVQAMVASESAGVMFTLDPVTNDKSVIVIDAAFGLGEAVVSGAVTPDRYVVRKEPLEITDREVNRQPWRIVRRTDATGLDANRHEPVPATDQATPKLTDEQILELARLGLKVEAHYGNPQDTEWALADGRLYLVQARPVTTLTRTVPVRSEVRSENSEVKTVPGPDAETPTSNLRPLASSLQPLLKGAPASLGRASGVVRIVHSPADLDTVQAGNVLVAEQTSPDYVPAMKRAAAIVTDTGGRTSHAAIVSRELGIPCVVGTGTASHTLKDGQVVTVDATAGFVFAGKVDLPTATLADRSRVTAPGSLRSEVPVTGTKVYVNLADPDLAEQMAAEPVDGVGLLRAEFMIAGFGEHPAAMEQAGRGGEFTAKLAEQLTRFASAFTPRPVIYRSSDFKTNEYRSLKGGEPFEPQEENPMIGYRGAIRYLAEPQLFRRELDAIKQVHEQHPNLWLMLPFVRTVDELRNVLALVAAAGLERGPDFRIFMMCEVPSNVILLDEFLDVGIDGVSIGSNDLTQLILGVDRDNERLAAVFDERDPAVVKALRYVIHTCRKRNVSVSICGQAPSFYPDLTELLVEAGITSVSINPDVIVSTRQLIASIERRLVLKAIVDRKN
jgi:pyruvate,water dikinase